MPCRVGQHNSFDLVGSKDVDYLGTHCSKESNLISENSSHEKYVLEEQPIEKLKVKSGKRFRLPSWQRRKRCKRLISQDCCTQEPSGKVLNTENDLHKTSDKSINVLDGVDLKSDQLVSETTLESVFLDLEYNCIFLSLEGIHFIACFILLLELVCFLLLARHLPIL